MKIKNIIYVLEVKNETYIYTDREEAVINYEYENMMGNTPILRKLITTTEVLDYLQNGVWC
jgi:hypothetical protein